MKKIPTLLVRDPDDRQHVLLEINPGCEWVLDGEGMATRKFDGTCVMLDSEGKWWSRREVKHGVAWPTDFVKVTHDDVTGKTMGWIPIEQSSFYKHIQPLLSTRRKVGTYEFVGPKVNGNPEGLEQHQLIEHGGVKIGVMNKACDVEEIAGWIQFVGGMGWEGVVWHHPDGRMVKLKVRDFK